MGEDCKDSQDFGRGFMRIHETGRGFARICEDLQDFGRGFMRLWERIHKTLGEDSWGFVSIHETLGEDL